jgi:hypothetical protein
MTMATRLLMLVNSRKLCTISELDLPMLKLELLSKSSIEMEVVKSLMMNSLDPSEEK